MSQVAIDDVVARLSREGIHVTTVPVGESLHVEVLGTVWSQPHTWLRVFMEFLRSGYCVTIR